MDNLIFKELKQGESFDLFSVNAGAIFTQTEFYGKWQEALDRKVRRFAGGKNGRPEAYFLVVKYPLAFGKTYLYCPYGPVIRDYADDVMLAVRRKMSEIAKEESAVFVRLDFSPAPSDAEKKIVEKYFRCTPRYSYHSAYFQPRFDWILDLKKSEDEILRGMHKNARYGIRFAEKAGVRAEIISSGLEKYLDDFYFLMKETSERNGFGVHEKEYYRAAFRETEKEGAGFLCVASVGGEPAVIDFFVVFNNTANYVFSGSGNKHRNLMPSYLSKWAAIKHARSIGCKIFNFGGVSGLPAANPSGTKADDGDKKWEGISLFKKRFGGEFLRHSDFYDLVCRPFWYHLYNLRKLLKNHWL